MIDFIGANLGADFRRSRNIDIAIALLHFCKLADMIGRITDADMAIVNVLARENHLFTVKAVNDDAFPVLDGKERVVFTVDEADHALILVRVWKGNHAHDIYGFSVCHLASPRSFVDLRACGSGMGMTVKRSPILIKASGQ